MRTTTSKALWVPRSLLAWPAWMRATALLPLVILLWLGVAWASMDVVPW